MLNLIKKERCSGCHACAAVCPKHAISMIQDPEGFLYPWIDERLCIDCELCEKVCQAYYPLVTERTPVAYACNHKDEDIRAHSSSGGAFTAFATWIIQQGGIVFGAAFDEKHNVSHIAVESIEDLHKLRESKYVQSIIGDTYIYVKEYLEKGRIVLFTGTPCQIDGLLHYLNKEYKTLYTQDIICHGVPSPKVWEKYLKCMEKYFNSTLKRETHPSFRSKTKGWIQYSQYLSFDNGREYREIHGNDIYFQAFVKNYSLRPSCYQCNSKTLNRNSDITLGDLWGIQEICPELFDDRGTSMVLVNSEKGRRLIEEIKRDLVYRPIDYNVAISHNRMAYQSVSKPKKREWFFNNLDCLEFDILVKRATKRPILLKIFDNLNNYFWGLRYKMFGKK